MRAEEGRAGRRSAASTLLLDRQALWRAADLLGQGQAQHAVVIPGLGVGFVDIGRQLEAARHLAVVALGAQHLFAFGLAVLLADFGAQGDDTAFNGNVDVFLANAGYVRLHGEVLVGFLHVDADLRGRGQRVAMQGLHEEAGRHVLEEVIEQTAASHQRIHGMSPGKNA